MAEPTPFAPTIQDLAFPDPRTSMGADIGPKPALGDQTQMGMQMGVMPWWFPAIAAAMGLRRRGGGVGNMPQFTPAQMGSAARRRMISANDNARDQNVDMPMLNTGNQSTMSTGGPARSHVGRLNALNPQQFQVYLDARSRGMSPVDAMAAAQGAQ